MTVQREGWFPQWDVDFSYGKEGEQTVIDIIDGMTTGKTEVKRDSVYPKTGNVYVEYECLRQGEYQNSGIRSTEADVWTFVLGDSDICISIKTSHLQKLFNHYYELGLRHQCRKGSHPTQGVAIPVEAIIHYAQTGNIGLNSKYPEGSNLES